MPRGQLLLQYGKRCVYWCALICLLLIPIWLRLLYANAHQAQVKSLLYRMRYGKVDIRGVIDDDPVTKAKNANITVHVLSVRPAVVGAVTTSTSTSHPVSSWVDVDTRILVTIKQYPQYAYGDSLILSGRISPPRNFSDGGSSGGGAGTGGDSNANGGTDSGVASDPREFDYVHYLSKDGILFVMKNPDIVIENVGGISGTGGRGNPLYKVLFRFKDAFLGNLKRVLGEPQASLAGGLVVGEKSTLGKDLLDNFRKSGLIHVVILSGYSINIIAGSVRSLLSFLPRTGSLLLSGFAIVLFGIMVGGKATVIRACAMALVGIFAQLMYRDYNALRALFFVGYIMVLHNPYIVQYDASFQVSFVSTLGLILFGRYIERALAHYPRIFTEHFGIRSLITSTLATQFAVAPLLLYMMGDASLVGVFANLLVLPLIPITMVVVFVTGMIGFLHAGYYITETVVAVAHVLLTYQLFIVNTFGNLPFGIFEVRHFPLWLMWLTYAGYALLFIVLRSQDSPRRLPS